MLLCGGRKFDLKVLLVTEILKHAALFFLLLFLKIPKTVFLEVVYQECSLNRNTQYSSTKLAVKEI